MPGKLLRLKIAILLVLALCLPAAASPNYFTTAHYQVYYDLWEDVGRALANGKYLDAAYESAASVTGVGVDRLIPLYMYSQPTSRSDGSFWYGQGGYIRLNMLFGNSTAPQDLANYADTLAHETTHAIFNYVTHDESDEACWLDEGLAYYAGSYVYPANQLYASNYLGWQLKDKSRNGATKISWYDTGIKYMDGTATALVWWQFAALGNYLYHLGGASGIATLLTNLSQGLGLEAALEAAYGKASGMYSTDTTADTLYADYFRFYYGSS